MWIALVLACGGDGTGKESATPTASAGGAEEACRAYLQVAQDCSVEGCLGDPACEEAVAASFDEDAACLPYAELTGAQAADAVAALECYTAALDGVDCTDLEAYAAALEDATEVCPSFTLSTAE